jgi:hypothetical protein
MNDIRVLLQDIIQSFALRYGKWLRRESGNAQLALDLAAHQTELEHLLGVACEQHDTMATFPPSADAAEIDHPGR